MTRIRSAAEGPVPDGPGRRRGANSLRCVVPPADRGDGQSVAQESRLRVLAASRRVSVYRGAAVLGRSNFGRLQRVGYLEGRLVLQRFCARGRAHSAKHIPRRQKRKNNRARRPVNSQARTPALLCQRPCLRTGQ